MNTKEQKLQSTMDRLVSRLEQDIRQRGLRPGDKYLTAPEAANMMSVSTATVHRAMQTLSKRGMLVRRPNLGTFVGPHFEVKQSTMIRTVYVVAMECLGLLGDSSRFDAAVSGIRSQFNDANVTMCSLPRGDVAEYIRTLLESAFAAGKVVGFIPISCPREVYRQLSSSGAPTVILGTPYSDEQDIPSIDVDNLAAGRLLADYLIDRGHRRMALLAMVEGRPGDSYFYDGLSNVLTAAELPHNSLIMRIAPQNMSAVKSELNDLLSMPDPPTAIILRSLDMAKLAAQAIKTMEQPAARNCEIVYQNQPVTELSRTDELPFAHVQPRLSFRAIGALAGEMLEQLENGAELDERHLMVPVELVRRAEA